MTRNECPARSDKPARDAPLKKLWWLMLVPVAICTFGAHRPAAAQALTAELCRDSKAVSRHYYEELSEVEDLLRFKINRVYFRDSLTELRRAISGRYVIDNLSGRARELGQPAPSPSTQQQLAFQRTLRDLLERKIERAARSPEHELKARADTARHQIDLRKRRMEALKCDAVFANHAA